MADIGVPEWDEERAMWSVGETRHHLIGIIPMIYNHRVVLSPRDDPRSYDAGWCFDSYASALVGVVNWDLTTTDGPPGHIKFVGWALSENDFRRALV